MPAPGPPPRRTTEVQKQALREIRDFIDQTVAEIDAIPDRLARDEPITITLELILTIDDEDKERLNLEMDQANKNIER